MASAKVRSDPLRLEVFHHLFAAVAEEMGVSLMRSAFSPNIKERRDFSCALFDASGRMIAQAAHLPVHLGSAPLSLAAAMEAVEMQPGDAVVLNDPFEGGTHLPDITFVSPVFVGAPGSVRRGERPDYYCVNRAHHADVGGAFPGSMSPVGDVHGEGLRIPPIKLVRAGEIDRERMRLLLANMRVPSEREADLLAQWAANRVGERRLLGMVAEHGPGEVRRRADQLMDWTHALQRELVRGFPRGVFEFEDALEEVGEGGADARIRLRLEVGRGGRLTFDFRESDAQVRGPVNTVRAVALSAVFYVLRLLLPPGTPTNEGVLRGVEVLTRPGTVVDACYPAPVAAGNVETSQRLVDVLLGAMARLLPERVPAASAGTMSNLTFGTSDDGARSFAYYETVAGGAGAGPLGPGAHAVQTHMTNTRNTPIEALENQLPVRLLAYTVERGSGGAGRHAGGDGVRRRMRFLGRVRIGWMAERQQRGPWGLRGGADGRAGAAFFREATGRTDRRLPGKASLELAAGGEVEVRTPGGGGYGRARRRE